MQVHLTEFAVACGHAPVCRVYMLPTLALQTSLIPPWQVEVWDNGRWSFVGAIEPDPAGLNRTWFFPYPAKCVREG